MKFTVAIPAYKGKYLRDCIHSILSQDYDDFELIVVDDASPDDIGKIVSEFDDRRILYYCNDENSGAVNVVDNWNRCLKYARGEYICLMGDDDIMASCYLSEMAKLAEHYPNVGVLHGRTMEINENSENVLLYQVWPEYQSVYDLIWHRIARLRVSFISDFTFKVDVLNSSGGFYKQPLAWASDDITSYIAAEKNGIASTNRVVFYYRRHSTSITSSGDITHKLKAIIDEEKWLRNFVSRSLPVSDEEKVLCEMIRKQIPRHIGYRKSLEICQLWRAGSFKRIASAAINRKDYGMTLRQIVRGIFMALGN